MGYKNLGNAGCVILILVLILIFSLVGFASTLIFKTPLGIVLLLYIIYRYYKRNKQVNQPESFEFKSEQDEVIDVEYNEVDDYEVDDDDY